MVEEGKIISVGTDIFEIEVLPEYGQIINKIDNEIYIFTKKADGTIHIDDTMCTGCGLCETLCKFNAIELVKEGDK